MPSNSDVIENVSFDKISPYRINAFNLCVWLWMWSMIAMERCERIGELNNKFFSLFLFCFLNKCQGFRKSMDSIDCNFHTFENWLQSLFHVKSHWLFYMFVEKKKVKKNPFFFSCLIGSWQDNRLLLSLSILLIISIHENIEKPSSHPSLVYISHLFVSVHGILFLQ